MNLFKDLKEGKKFAKRSSEQRMLGRGAGPGWRSVLRAWKTSAAGTDVDPGDERMELDGDPEGLWHGLHGRPLKAGVILEMQNKALTSSQLGFRAGPSELRLVHRESSSQGKGSSWWDLH